MFYRVTATSDNRHPLSCDDWGVSTRVPPCGVAISPSCGYIAGYSYFNSGWYRRVKNSQIYIPGGIKICF